MEQIEKTLSQLKKGDFINFEYNPFILGISSKKFNAKFVRWNSKQNTMTYKNLYFDPIVGEGAEKTIDYNMVSHLEKQSLLRGTGPR